VDDRLLGRVAARRQLTGMLDAVERRGSSLVVVGEAGVGKSALISSVAAEAGARGFTVRTSRSVPSETHLPFAALFPLLEPSLPIADGLPDAQRRVILGALGFIEVEGIDPSFLALATLNLLREQAVDAPLLVVAEDVQWLDRQSAEVLGFVARRIQHDPIVFLASSRTTSSGQLNEARVAELDIEGLDEDDARSLVEAHAPGLAPQLRERLLDEANGNPLALIELSRHWSRLPPGTIVPSLVPVTDRLAAVFTERYRELSEPTRLLLLVAALDAGAFGPESMQAATRLAGTPVDPSMLDAAIAARLLRVEGGKIRCQHPLVPAALAQTAGLSERRAAHAALAAAHGDSDRATWHRAAAVVGTDEQVAAALDEFAVRGRRRGAVDVALTALERAAELSPDPAHRGRRLVRAAELAFDLGRPDAADRLLDAAEQLRLDPVDRARAMWRRQILGDGSCRSIGQVQALVRIIDQMAAAGDTDLALDSMVTVADTAWQTDFDAGRRAAVAEAADGLAVRGDDPRLLNVLGLAQPVERGFAVVEQIRAIAPSRIDDPGDLRLLGTTAGFLGDPETSAFFLDHAVRGLRAQGRLGPLSNALVSRSWAAWHLGRWDTAASSAAEAVVLGEQSGRPMTASGARLVQGALAAARGDAAAAEAITGEAEATFRRLGATTMLALAALVTGFAMLSDDRPLDAVLHLQPYFDDENLGAAMVICQGSLGTFVDAGLQCGRRDSAVAAVEAITRLATRGRSPTSDVVLTFAETLLAPDERAEQCFDHALRQGTTLWPFPRARLLLAQGSWLRRQQRIVESRIPLRAARDTFDRLGATVWADRTRRELRASGESSGDRRPDVLDRLTPQEVEIVKLAASGLANREIGLRLYLSHRTVASHLYRAFPKLGITSRSELSSIVSAGTD
jgi:DNA-binding CsgD family transcriptional regulator